MQRKQCIFTILNIRITGQLSVRQGSIAECLAWNQGMERPQMAPCSPNGRRGPVSPNGLFRRALSVIGPPTLVDLKGVTLSPCSLTSSHPSTNLDLYDFLPPCTRLHRHTQLPPSTLRQPCFSLSIRSTEPPLHCPLRLLPCLLAAYQVQSSGTQLPNKSFTFSCTYRARCRPPLKFLSIKTAPPDPRPSSRHPLARRQEPRHRRRRTLQLLPRRTRKMEGGRGRLRRGIGGLVC